MAPVSTLPGIVFESAPPTVVESLPRMDVAGFVGFAASGPVDLPVLVEDPLTFRDVFGPDVEVARTDEGAAVHAHLGRAVEAFFANGGRRAWVVRVARTEPAESVEPAVTEAAATNRFVVPGLVVPGAAGSVSGWRLASLDARSPGAWSDRLEIGAAIEVTSTVAVGVRPAEVVLDHGVDVAVGDLVRVVLDEAASLVAEVSTISLEPGGRCLGLDARTARLEVSRLPKDGARAHLLGLDRPVRLSSFALDVVGGDDVVVVGGDAQVSRGDVLATESVPGVTLVTLGDELPHGAAAGSRRFSVRHAVGVDPIGTIWPEPAAARPVVEVVRGRLTARDGEQVLATLPGLGLGPAHARALVDLPGDDRLFGALLASGRADSGETAHADVRPVLSPLEREVASPRFPFAGPGADTRILPVGSPTDPTQVVFGRRVVAAEDRPPPARNGLANFDAALFVDPALASLGVETVLATACDLGRAGRPTRRLRGIHALVALDEVTLVAVPDAGHTGWSKVTLAAPPPLLAPELRIVDVDEAGLALQWTRVPSATSHEVEVDLAADFPDPVRDLVPDTSARVPARSSCPAPHFVRVRALRGDEAGPWSAVRVEVAPPRAFAPCTLPDALPQAQQPRAPLAPTTVWRSQPPSLAEPWLVLRAVQSALLRWCAARGDVLAALSMPVSFRPEQVVRHVAVLRGEIPSFGTDGRETEGRSLAGGVPALTQDEAFVLGYAAAYHPWVVTGTPGADLRATPPEGAVLGTWAARTIARGAWHAPARRPIERTLALQPRLDSTDHRALVGVGVNPIAEDPSGFLALTAATLSDVEAVRPANVRRLIALLRRLAAREGVRIVFEPHDRELRRTVRMRFERFLTELYLRGAFAGSTPQEAFDVSTGDAVNPPEALDSGRFVVQVRMAPSRPMEHVTVRLVLAGTEHARGDT